MKIRITKGGIFGQDGEIAVGTEIDIKEEPKGWVGRYEVISGSTSDGAEGITNPALDRDDLKKQAEELGLTYAQNIPTAKLKELVDAKLAE